MSNLMKIGLKAKFIGVVTFACTICFTVAVGVAIHYNKKEFENGLVDKSRTIHSRLDAATKYVARQGGLKTVVEAYKKKYTSSDQLTDEDKKEILKQVPIYAAMQIGSDDAEKEHYRFRVFSNEPRNKDNQATNAEMEIFNKFEGDPALKEWVENNGQMVTVFRPVRIVENHGCLTCHGHPSTSPWGNGKDILGFKMENWKDGKLHGVFAVSNDVAVVQKAQSDAGGANSAAMLAMFIAIGALVAIFLAFLIIRRPIDLLRASMSAINGSSTELTKASGSIAGSSQALAQATTEQASSLEETAASLEEITAMISKAVENANATATTSSESQRRAEAGSEAVTQMMSSMKEISDSNDAILAQVTQGNQRMTEIVSVIQEIGQKTKVINDIVFQTKLLSFNASVEAARAGEHGKGFAVVAEEVGNLAQMSGNAAKEITEMLDSSVKKVEAIVVDTKRSVETIVAQGKQKVENGVNTAKLCADVLHEIVKNVDAVSTLAQEISNASKEQAQGVSEINKAVGQLDAVTQQNATASEESAKSADSLAQQASSLRRVVAEMMEIVEGDAAAGKSPVDAPPAGKSGSGGSKSNVFPLKKAEKAEGTAAAAPTADGTKPIPASSHKGFVDV